MLHYQNILNKVESQLFEKLITGPIKGEENECMVSYGKFVPYYMYSNGFDSVYKQVEYCQPQVYVEECKYTNAGRQLCNMLIDSIKNGLSEA